MINESSYLNKINVNGTEYKDLPENLYIPPSALRVVLKQFEGPLDLLLYLIKKKNIDPLEINMTEITSQYLRYVEGLSSAEFELAGEYLLMASLLIQIKSKMLLPNETEDLNQEDDPRAVLIKKLIEYEKFKNASIELSSFTIHGRDNSKVCLEVSKTEPEIPKVAFLCKNQIQCSREQASESYVQNPAAPQHNSGNHCEGPREGDSRKEHLPGPLLNSKCSYSDPVLEIDFEQVALIGSSYVYSRCMVASARVVSAFAS